MRHDPADPPIAIAVSLAFLAPLAIGLSLPAHSSSPTPGWRGATAEPSSLQSSVRTDYADRAPGSPAVQVRPVPDPNDDQYVEELLRIHGHEALTGAVSNK